MSDAERHRPTINRAELAGICNCSLPTVDAWVRKGCPVVARGGKGKEWQFDSAAVIDWRIERAVADVANVTATAEGSITKEEADRRKAVAQAVVAEVEADEALKSVISRFDAEMLTADFCQALKSALSNVSTKVAGRAATMSDPNEIRDFTDAEVNRAYRAAHADLQERWNGGASKGDGSDDD